MAVKPVASIIVALALFAWAVPAVADAIDENWCFGVKRLSINGSEIVTPGGKKITGDYGRHYFTYTVPAGEAGAGQTVDMDLLGDDDMRLWPNGRSPDPSKGGAQMWKRCRAQVS